MDRDKSTDESPVYRFLIERWNDRSEDRSCPSYLIIEEIARVVDEKNEARSIPAFDNWLLIFDEIVNWFSSLALALKREFLSVEPRASLHLSVMTVLATKASADLFAIRILMLRGHEVQARILARSAVETIELMFLAPHDPELEEAFYEANDLEKCNQFWHRYISNGTIAG